MLKSVSVGVLVAAMSCSLFVGGGASAQSVTARRPGHHQNHRPPYRPPHHHHRPHRGGNGGAVVAAGLAGLFVGAALANANRYDPPPAPIPYDDIGPYTQPYAGHDWHSYCAAKFSTYDPRDGRYLAVDGQRYPCH
ncbi:MAG: BA14K family protein [Pseudomonadota bacterium]|nr:BA14K family protein [Pseudomonadota bacterium]